MGETMEIVRAYKLVLDPTDEQRHTMLRYAGAQRKAFNKAIEFKRAAHRSYNQDIAYLTYLDFAHLDPDAALKAAKDQIKKAKLPEHHIPSWQDMSNWYTKQRGDDREGIDGFAPWWYEIDRRAFISGFKDADAAWNNWLASLSGKRAGRKMGYPRFKKRGRCTDSYALFHDVKKPSIRLNDARHLRLPSIGVVRMRSSARRVLTKLNRGDLIVQSARISRRGKHWQVCLLVKEQVPVPHTTKRQRANGAVALDVGVKSLAVLSTGEVIENPRTGRRDAERVAYLQRKIARCQKGSTNRTKLVRQLGAVKSLQAERRQQTLHQLTKKLTTQYATVVIEDLNVAGMTHSAKGTVDKPGRNVKAKAGLNREILDVAFGELRRQLTYKTGWYGSELAVMDRFLPSSKTCSNCGFINASLTLADRTYRCPACGFTIDRDLNAALNLIAVWRSGHAMTDVSARPTPAPDLVCTTPDTCDARVPEANIGMPGEDDLTPCGDGRPVIREDPLPGSGPPLGSDSQGLRLHPR